MNSSFKGISATSYILFSLIVCLALFRPNTLIVNQPLDDSFALNQTQQILGEDPINLPRLGSAIGSFVAPGMSIAMIPSIFASKLIADYRNEDETEWAWAAMAVTGFFVWCLCFPLTVRLLETFPSFRNMDKNHRFIFGLFVFLNIPLVSNSIGHPGSQHIYEVFFALLMTIFLREKRLLLATLACSALSMTRFNDVPAFLMVAGAWIDQGRPWPKKPVARWAIFGVIGIAILATWHVAMIALVRGYGTQTLQGHLADMSWANVRGFFFHFGHGVFYTYCLWTVGFVLGLGFWNRISWAARAGWVWMATHVFLYSFWGGPGASLGHRYLCGNYAAVILILGELFLGKQARLARIQVWDRAIPTAIMGVWITILGLTFCTTQQLNYSVEMTVEKRPGVLFHPFYMDRFLQICTLPRLYRHLLELGLVGSLALTEWDPDPRYYGEAILPKDSVAVKAASALLLANILAGGAAITIMARSRRKK